MDTSPFITQLRLVMQLSPPTAIAHANLIGVTLHKRTQRFEAHIWQDKKQLYLGSYDAEMQAGRAHDILALRTKGLGAKLNYPLSQYEGIVPVLQHMSQADVIAGLRQFSRALSAARSQNAPKRAIVAKPRKPRSVTELSMNFSDSLPAATVGRKRRLTETRTTTTGLATNLPKLDLFVRPRRHAAAVAASPSKGDGFTPNSSTPNAEAAALALATMWQSMGSSGDASPGNNSPPDAEAMKPEGIIMTNPEGKPDNNGTNDTNDGDDDKKDIKRNVLPAPLNTPKPSAAAELLATSAGTPENLGPLLSPNVNHPESVQRTLSYLSRMQETLALGH